MIMICLTLSTAVLTAAEKEIDQKLAQQMEQDYQKACLRFSYLSGKFRVVFPRGVRPWFIRDG